MNHTPGPWHYEKGETNGPDPAGVVAGVISDGEGWNIAEVCADGLHPDEDANLIVRAVNSHDALVAALEAVWRVAEHAELPGPVYLSIEERDQIRAALKTAYQ